MRLTDEEVERRVEQLIAAGRIPAWVRKLPLRCTDADYGREDAQTTGSAEAS
jgi:hypothetical protein